MTTTGVPSPRAEQASTAWPGFAPQTGPADGPLGAAQAADRELARQYALRARALAAFASTRPASADRAPGEPGAMSPERWAARPEIMKPISEWAAQEASIGLTCSRGKADQSLAEALTLTSRLPGTLAALEGGMLTVDHRFCLLEHLAPIAEARVRAEIEAEVLRWVAERAARKTITTPAQLAGKVLRVVTRRDARAAAQRALRALRDRGIYRDRARGEGLAGLAVVGTVPEIEALHAALGGYVDALDDGEDRRTRGEKMLAVLLDLVLRPGEGRHAAVQVALTLVAGVQTLLGGDVPGELNGQVVSAETARQLLNALAGAGLGDGVLAELQWIAATDTDTDTDADIDSATAPARPDGGDEAWFPDPSPDGWDWTEQMRAAHAAWEMDWARRLAVGEFDDPDPMPDAVWAASVAARLASGEIDLELERELADARERWWREFEAGWHADPDPPDDRPGSATEPPPIEPPPAEPPPAEPSPAEASPASGWWAAADRALADASAAKWDAEQALARAGRLVRTAARADAADQTGWRNCAAGRVDAAEDAMTALRAASVADRAALGDLLARSAGGLAERPRLALVDALSGALVGLTDLPGLRRAAHCGRPACRRDPERCGHDLSGRPGPGAPGPTAGYRPGAELDRFIRARDRRCRFPGCRRPVARGEIDHRLRWPDGPTDVPNLVGLCTGHHRGKHQAPGFEHDLTGDGVFVVTTPSGLTATTEPPPY